MLGDILQKLLKAERKVLRRINIIYKNQSPRKIEEKYE
jgi:hypothetical protein